MSYYFRPPNSREQNLFIIRTSIDNMSYVNFTNNTLNNTAYTSPSNVFLPPGFSLSFNSTSNTIFTIDYTNAKYEIPPTLNIQTKYDLETSNGIGPWYTSILSVSNTQATFYIYSLIIENGVITPNYPLIVESENTLLNVGLQIQIIGRTLTGPTFAIANQGWTYVESTNPSNDTIYSAMPVGTNGVIPPFGLTIGGSYGYLGGAGNGGNPSTTTLQNYSPTEAMNNINNYYFFPIALGSINEVFTMPVATKIGKEVVIVLNQNPNNVELAIAITNTAIDPVLPEIVLKAEGDTIKFVALNRDAVGLRWVKINNM
jgi:hypothetical protein